MEATVAAVREVVVAAAAMTVMVVPAAASAAVAAAAATAAWGRATSCRGRSNFQSRRKKALIGGGIGRTGDLPCGGS